MAEKKKEKLSLAALVQKIRKNYGDVITIASKAKALKIPRIRTGVFLLDLSIGGGIPVGRVTVLYGPFSSGKTLLSLLTIKRAQNMCRKCYADLAERRRDGEGELVAVCPNCGKSEPMRVVFFDAEGCWSNDWSEKVGIDIEEVYVIRTEFAEQGIDVADAMLRSGEVDLLIIDSVAALTPKKEIESGMEEWQMGLAARLLNKAIRKWVSSLNVVGMGEDWRPTIILINQVRANIGSYGAQECLPGGKGQLFGSSLMVRLKAGKFKFAGGKDYSQGADDLPLYVDVSFTIKKSKVSPPKREGRFRLRLKDFEGYKVGDTDETNEIVKLARKYGLITTEGATKWFCEGEEFRSLTELTDAWSVGERLERLKERLVAVLNFDG